MDKRHHAHVAEEEEPVRKEERRTNSDDEYVCIATLTGSVNHEDNTWLIDSGASKHIFGYTKTFVDLAMKDSSPSLLYQGQRVTSYKLISGRQLKMEDVLFVLELKRNLLSILGLEKKGFRVAFVDGEVLIWPKGKTIEDAEVIGVHKDGLYRYIGKPVHALVHSTISPCEMWHRRFGHLHYRALPLTSKAVILEI